MNRYNEIMGIETETRKTHMESAIDGRDKTLCGVKVPEGTENVTNPSGKPTCKRCLSVVNSVGNALVDC